MDAVNDRAAVACDKTFDEHYSDCTSDAAERVALICDKLFDEQYGDCESDAIARAAVALASVGLASAPTTVGDTLSKNPNDRVNSVTDNADSAVRNNGSVNSAADTSDSALDSEDAAEDTAWDKTNPSDSSPDPTSAALDAMSPATEQALQVLHQNVPAAAQTVESAPAPSASGDTESSDSALLYFRPGDGMELGTDDGTTMIKPVGISESTGGTPTSETSVFSANVQPGTDLATNVQPTGVTSYVQVRDNAAPATFKWQVDVPDGSHLVSRDDGSVVLTKSDGTNVLQIGPPTATGRTQSTPTLSAVKDVVTLSAPRISATAANPVEIAVPMTRNITPARATAAQPRSAFGPTAGFTSCTKFNTLRTGQTQLGVRQQSPGPNGSPTVALDFDYRVRRSYLPHLLTVVQSSTWDMKRFANFVPQGGPHKRGASPSYLLHSTLYRVRLRGHRYLHYRDLATVISTVRAAGSRGLFAGRASLTCAARPPGQ